MIYATEAERDAAWHEVLAACPGMELTSSLPCNMEINAPGVTKGSGLMALARTLGAAVIFYHKQNSFCFFSKRRGILSSKG